MKLGYNVLTTSRSSHSRSVAGNANARNDTDASEPLLNNHQSSNIITDYYAHTRAAFQPGGVISGGYTGQCPSRTICSPQHPSQDLIEMLNRNQQVSLIRAEVKQKQKQKQKEKPRQQPDATDVHSIRAECQQLSEILMQNMMSTELNRELETKARITHAASQQDKESDRSEINTDNEQDKLLNCNRDASSNENLICFSSVSDDKITQPVEEDIGNLTNSATGKADNEGGK